jgi:serralysin
MTGENPDRYCAVLFPRDETASGRAALLDVLWAHGGDVRVRFVEGDHLLRDRVRAVAERWTAPGMATGLRFEWVAEGPAEIRIAFAQGNGSWSYLGTQCQEVPEDEPTMNFGWLTSSSPDDEVQRVVLHEFGHALGLGHEHQNAAASIRWNEPAVFAALRRPPFSWDEETIRHNVFDQQDVFTASTVDPESIMMYPIPAAWTLDGTSADLNPDLSPNDVAMIRQFYGDEDSA